MAVSPAKSKAPATQKAHPHQAETTEKMKNQIKEIEHKLSSKLICTLQREGVQRLVIGDVRSIRKDLDVGSTNNQKLHQWSFGSMRHKLTYKASVRHACDPARGTRHLTQLPGV